MRLPFLDRRLELEALRRGISAPGGGLVVLYGRRRCGKSRLLLEALKGHPTAYYVGDEREGSTQRRSLSRAISSLIPGFDRVMYSDWEALLDRWAREAPADAILALDEFQYMAACSPELASLLQKQVDAPREKPFRVVLCGSSQRMMHGLVLDASAPLYGRAREIIKIGPLAPGWIRDAFPSWSTQQLLHAYAAWGGVPRYWELAAQFKSTGEALHRMLLDPLGVLRDEPSRLLLDDKKEIAQASSILSLIGEGCHKLSEIAGRLGRPATSLSRPLARLADLGLVKREVPFGTSEKESRRSLYRIADPFLSFWFRFVDPKRALIEARQEGALDEDLRRFFPSHLGEVWEELSRASVSRLTIGRTRWRPAARWWGPGLDRQPLELDIVALSEDGSRYLAGEAKLQVRAREWPTVVSKLKSRIARCPVLDGKQVVSAIWCASGRGRRRDVPTVSVADVLAALK
ncbi:MAG: ATP-binding protein [Planctomycetes bacterium]|nr:ATP-binding protein [Planctomycetota bacterium]